ncbi:MULTISPECIES: peptidoglycan-binding domain-containing protein [Rhodomicrobium]|uniref:peptidoglycan-binding domain-containing protein n=1 Tax=Rhodomicrobium TaxID=1068 RepID=UPI000B4BD2FD|nr:MULTISPECIES: peptidoglycan-binding domain-containing protein [Rhodomicrobium]
MTPLRLRLFGSAFVAVAAAITVNALYLQEAPKLAGTAARARPAELARAAPVAPVPAPAPVAAETTATATAALQKEEVKPEAPAASIPRSTLAPLGSLDAVVRDTAPPPPAKLVRAIQRELAGRGYSVGQESGLLGMQTRAAILAFEFDEGLPLAGEASEAVLKSLIFGKAAGKRGPGPDGRFEGRQALVAGVQDMLARMGYTSGPVDGQLDGKTRDAIRKFESDRHLQAEGRLTERVLLEMVIVTGRPFDADG